MRVSSPQQWETIHLAVTFRLTQSIWMHTNEWEFVLLYLFLTTLRLPQSWALPICHALFWAGSLATMYGNEWWWMLGLRTGAQNNEAWWGELQRWARSAIWGSEHSPARCGNLKEDLLNVKPRRRGVDQPGVVAWKMEFKCEIQTQKVCLVISGCFGKIFLTEGHPMLVEVGWTKASLLPSRESESL